MVAVHIPPAWAHSAAIILQNRWRKTLVIGAADRGKSTYCNVLAQTLGAAGCKVAFVDADIGQKDLGPPATISLAYLDVTTGLSQARLAGLYFVGSVSPVRHFLPMIVGTRRLVDAARAPFVIIDTTGLVQGGGRLLTAFQIESLQPDIIVTVEKNGELGPIVKACRHYQVIRLHSSPQAVPKSREARRAAREQSFRAYFADAEEIILDLNRLVMQRCLLFNGKRYADPRFVYAEKTPEGIIGIAATPEANQAAGLQVVPAGFEHNLLCGLADRHGEGLGLGIIKAIDLQSLTITLWTPVPFNKIRVLQLGELYLGRDGRELQDRLTMAL
jgi:polynucleotide 5'-hydroxyl-kinase GRC3/NOL9